MVHRVTKNWTRLKQLCTHVLSSSVMSTSLQPRGLKPSRLLHPWDSPGKNTGVGCHALLQEILFLPGECHGQRNLEGFSPQSCKELCSIHCVQLKGFGLYESNWFGSERHTICSSWRTYLSLHQTRPMHVANWEQVEHRFQMVWL